MKKQKYHEHDDPETTRPMKCIACHECREVKNKYGDWSGRCIYNGPFTKFITDEDYMYMHL
jgi:ferredoxin